MRPIRLPVLYPAAAVSPRTPFPATDVHIWRLDLAAAQPSIAALLPLLDAEEQARARRFHFAADRQRFIAAHGLVRCILGWYLAVPPPRLAFAAGPRGKPRLTAGSGSDLCFNLSHAYDVALLALAHGREVGVDIEAVRPGFASEQIAEQFFAPAEVAELRSLPAALQDEAFFACWTRKEAYIKARGDGVSLPLQSFTVTLAPGEPPQLVDVNGHTQEAQRWTLEDLGLRPDYRGALVIEGNRRALRWYTPEAHGSGLSLEHNQTDSEANSAHH